MTIASVLERSCTLRDTSGGTLRGTSHDVLTQFFEPNINLCIWQRALGSMVKDYAKLLVLENVSITRSFSVDAAAHELALLLPNTAIAHRDERKDEVYTTEHRNAQNKSAFIQELSVLIDMVACLFDCDTVGVRLTVLNRAMCPRFHTDKISGRLICTYSGRATQWLDSQYPEHTSQSLIALSEDTVAHKADEATTNPVDNVATPMVQQANVGDVLLLKGEAWPDNEQNGIVHRSPSCDDASGRLLLTIDPW